MSEGVYETMIERNKALESALAEARATIERLTGELDETYATLSAEIQKWIDRYLQAEAQVAVLSVLLSARKIGEHFLGCAMLRSKGSWTCTCAAEKKALANLPAAAKRLVEERDRLRAVLEGFVDPGHAQGDEWRHTHSACYMCISADALAAIEGGDGE